MSRLKSQKREGRRKITLTFNVSWLKLPYMINIEGKLICFKIIQMVFVVLGKFFTYLKGKLANSPNTNFFGGLGFNSS